MEEILNLVILVLEHHPDGSSKYSFRKIGGRQRWLLSRPNSGLRKALLLVWEKVLGETARQLTVWNNDGTLMNHRLSGETATYTVFCCLNVLASTVGLVTAWTKSCCYKTNPKRIAKTHTHLWNKCSWHNALIYSFHKYLLIAYSTPSTKLGSWETSVKKT